MSFEEAEDKAQDAFENGIIEYEQIEAYAQYIYDKHNDTKNT